MDSYSGSEPRLFISFRLDNEFNDQPLQLNAEEERMETSESFVTASSHAENPTLSSDQNCNQKVATLETDTQARSETVTEMDITIIPEGSQAKETEQVQEKDLTVMPQTSSTMQSELPTTPQTVVPTVGVESSSTDESCGAYIARKWQQLGDSPEDCTQGPSDGNLGKCSESIALELMPQRDAPDHTETDSDSVSRVAFLDSPVAPIKSNLKSMYKPPEAKIQKLCVKIGETRKEFSMSNAETEGSSHSEGCLSSTDEFGSNNPIVASPRVPSDRFASDTGHESAGPAGSTVADALYAPVDKSRLRVSDAGSVTSVDFPEEATRSPQLSASSRVMIKECFEAVTPVMLPPGHTTLALNESQVSNILKVVADEAVRSSLKAMENLVHQTCRLSLGTPQFPPSGRVTPKRSSYRTQSPGVQSGLLSGEASDTSGALRSDDEFASIGYAYEHSDLESQPFAPPPVGPTGCSQTNPMSIEGEPRVESPGTQTLAVLKAEAIAEKSKPTPRKKPRKKPSPNSSGNRHRVPRACKIMKEAYFKGMEWTKTFVSGPMDPRWNPYKIYCQICKGNVSIYGRGAREILRHHGTEKHLRKDQKWRYHHLATEDPVTKMVKHHVRGRDGRLLTPYELQLELPKFIGVELVDIGEKLPFYDDYQRGTDYMASSSENRTKVQVSVLGHYLRSFGDISTLRNQWRDIGVVVNHQSLFTDFDWSKERLSVSILLPSH